MMKIHVSKHDLDTSCKGATTLILQYTSAMPSCFQLLYEKHSHQKGINLFLGVCVLLYDMLLLRSKAPSSKKHHQSQRVSELTHIFSAESVHFGFFCCFLHWAVQGVILKVITKLTDAEKH